MFTNKKQLLFISSPKFEKTVSYFSHFKKNNSEVLTSCITQFKQQTVFWNCILCDLCT